MEKQMKTWWDITILEQYQKENITPKSFLSKLIDKGFWLDLLNKKEAKYLLPKVPKIQVIYYIPKIHKKGQTPPGRPIVSGIYSLYSRLGEYIDIFLQPIAMKGKAYFKDSRDLINMTKAMTVGDHTLLITVDAESLYTNIVQQDAFEAALWALQKYSHLKRLQIKNFLWRLSTWQWIKIIFGMRETSTTKLKGWLWGLGMLQALQIYF